MITEFADEYSSLLSLITSMQK